jgi:hypothetical protein
MSSGEHLSIEKAADRVSFDLPEIDMLDIFVMALTLEGQTSKQIPHLVHID